MMRSGWLCICVLALPAGAAEVMPPKPAKFFNDFGSVVPPGSASALNEQLAQYERESSNQLLVAIYPKMQTDSTVEDFATRIFESWGVGLKDMDNGAVLFVFVQDRKMRIQTGYGLEASLTDAESSRIIEGLKPFFRSGDYAGGFTLAVAAMIEATKGEYRGTGRTLYEQKGDRRDSIFFWVILGIIVFGIGLNFVMRLRQIRRGYVYGANGRYRLPGDSPWTWGGGWTGWGGGNTGGGSSSSGGSSWSGGGGSTGGGGASGSW